MGIVYIEKKVHSPLRGYCGPILFIGEEDLVSAPQFLHLILRRAFIARYLRVCRPDCRLVGKLQVGARAQAFATKHFEEHFGSLTEELGSGEG